MRDVFHSRILRPPSGAWYWSEWLPRLLMICVRHAALTTLKPHTFLCRGDPRALQGMTCMGGCTGQAPGKRMRALAGTHKHACAYSLTHMQASAQQPSQRCWSKWASRPRLP